MKRVLAQSWVIFHQLKSLRGVTLILGGGVVILIVLGANHPDNFSGFAFLCHVIPRSPHKPRIRVGQPANYDSTKGCVSRQRGPKPSS